MFISNAKPLNKLLMTTLEKFSCLLLEILVTKIDSFKMNRFNNYLFVIHKFLGVKCCHYILQNFMEW
jgi:phage gp36-like protein